MEGSVSQKSCFVISPIGSKGTDIRARSDQVFKHIINPVVSDLGYKADRADKITEPGMITDQIIEHLIVDDLVVADLTGRNANVFYELAIRHAVRKPIAIMISDGEDIPFDVSQSRAIQFNYRDLDSVAECKIELEKQISFLESKPDQVFSPISSAINLRAMRESDDPSAQRDARILSSIQALQTDLYRLERHVDSLSTGRTPSGYQSGNRTRNLSTSADFLEEVAANFTDVDLERRNSAAVRALLAARNREYSEGAERTDRRSEQDSETSDD